MPAPLARVIVFVHDVVRCAHFYRDVFGFSVVPGSHDPAEWTELLTGGCKLAFHKARGSSGPTGDESNPQKIVFYTDDVEAMRTRLLGLGIAMGPIHRYGSLQFCDGPDPEGHIFQICNRE